MDALSYDALLKNNITQTYRKISTNSKSNIVRDLPNDLCLSFQKATGATPNAIRTRLSPSNAIAEVKGSLDTSSISYEMPSNIQKNAVFLIDTPGKTVKHVAADGLGCYINNSTFRSNYELRDNI